MKQLGILGRTGFLALCFLLALSLSRLVLIVLFWDRVEATQGVAFILLQGLRFDLVLAGLLVGPVFLLKPWLHLDHRSRRIGSMLVPAWLGLVVGVCFFIEASTAPFIAQFDARPNYLFVEYLRYPRVVLATLTGTHLLELLVFSGAAIAAGLFAAWWLRRDPRADDGTSLAFCLLATPLIALLVVAGVRSTLDHRPVNPSTAAFSQDAMVNQLPLNSPYSVLYASYQKNRDSGARDIRYGEMSDPQVMKFIWDESGMSRRNRIDPDIPTLHRQKSTQPRKKPLNLIIVLEESLGAEFVGSLGGKDLTPALDELAGQGIWMEQLYATGIRSARGIEAILSGFTPTPLQSVIKLAETQGGFFTLASLLRSHGYTTSFIYGGEAHFDNMRRFFLNNGFDEVVDENDFEQPVFRGSWGVSDEDVFKRAHEQYLGAGERPFFSLLFTTSNHEPFDIPAGRVTPSEYGARETAVKYADHALGQFIASAKDADYWQNTVILVVADHNARIYGSHLVPVQGYHVPGVILGGSIEPRRVSGLSSQIDMLPTLLSLIGLSTEHPAIGRDLTRPEFLDGAGRAMMQFHANQAYMEDGWIIVMRPDLRPRSFRLDADGEWIWDNTAPFQLKRKALAYALFGPLMIRDGDYRLP